MKAYWGKSKINLAKSWPPVGIEPGTSHDPLCYLPNWANLASVNWEIFNFTFVGAAIDIGT